MFKIFPPDLSQRKTFVPAAALLFGILSTVGVLFVAGEFGGPGWWLFLILLSAAGSWGWAEGMWFFLREDFQRVSNPSAKRDT